MVKWGTKKYETGIQNVVLYPYDKSKKDYGDGVGWDGVTNITEKPSGAEPTALYADNIKYLNLMSNETFGCSIEAYQSPEEFDECDGTAKLAKGVTIGQQTRKMFGLCYKTLLGTQEDGTDAGFKLHIVYNCLAAPSEKAYATVNESPEAMTLSWEVSTTPVEVAGFKPTSIITINSVDADPTKLATLMTELYGTDEGESPVEGKLPSPERIAQIFAEA